MTEDHPMVAPGLTFACLQCVHDRKIAEADGTPEEQLPDIQVAITLVPMVMPPVGVCAVPACYGHITVQRASPLLAANGGGMPPGLRRASG